jgi:hypothetical protein
MKSAETRITMDKFTLDRATYKQIKAMDKDRLSEFLKNVYMNGKNDNEAVEVDMELLKSELGKIKGIGENRFNEIMTVIQTFLGKDNDNA